MSDFEKWFRSLNANGKTVYFLGNEHKVSEMAWNHQQAIIDNLKAQLNNMEACYIKKKKQVEACAALAAGWSAITWDKTTHWTEGYEEGCYHCSGQIEEALRGERD